MGGEEVNQTAFCLYMKGVTPARSQKSDMTSMNTVRTLCWISSMNIVPSFSKFPARRVGNRLVMGMICLL